MDTFAYNNTGHLWPDEGACSLQAADYLNFTPLEDVFAEYEDCLRRVDGDTPISSSNNTSFQQSDAHCETLLEVPHHALGETVRDRKSDAEQSEASVPRISSSAATSSDSGDEEYRPSSRASAAKSKSRSTGGVQKVKARRGQRQNQKQLPDESVLQLKSGCPSMSGRLQPFDVIKNYGMGGTMSLQQLNDRIKSYCSMS